MPSIAHITDPHLNFIKSPEAFGQFVRDTYNVDSAIISGDISECPSLFTNLLAFSNGFRRPYYFILGNHDYYRGSFHEADEEARRVVATDPNATWLTEKNVVLNSTTILLGQEGFYDARCGDRQSDLQMADFFVIEDMCHLEGEERLRLMRERADHEAYQASNKLLKAASEYSNVYFATHYPPFVGACWHEGGISDETWLPFFTSIAMGHALEFIAKKHPKVKFTVLCGHTHSKGSYKHSANLRVLTGISEYRNPQVSSIIKIGSGDGIKDR